MGKAAGSAIPIGSKIHQKMTHLDTLMKLTIGTTLDLWWPPTKTWLKGVILQKFENLLYSIEFKNVYGEPQKYHLLHFRIRNVKLQRKEPTKDQL